MVRAGKDEWLKNTIVPEVVRKQTERRLREKVEKEAEEKEEAAKEKEEEA